MKWEVKEPEEKWTKARVVKLGSSEFKGAAVEYAAGEFFSPSDEEEFEFDLRRTDDSGAVQTRRMTVSAEIRFFAQDGEEIDGEEIDGDEVSE